jgi:hypothetical protein
MSKGQFNTHTLYRSLLQKAVRRGDEDLIFTAASFLRDRYFNKGAEFSRLVAGITLEECWPLATDLVFNKKFHSKVAALIKVTRSEKARDALGLGFLAHVLFRGDRSVLWGDPPDRQIKIIANALHRPDDFWHWIDEQSDNSQRRHVVENVSPFKRKGSALERSVLKAAVYLAVSQGAIPLKAAPPLDAAFPYWVVFDHHTAHGRRALRDVARDLHIPPPQLAWCCYYFEGGRTNASVESPWWDRMCRWYFRKVALPMQEARLLWDPAKPQVVAALVEEAGRIHRKIYAWKLNHVEEVRRLKAQVHLFLDKIHRARADQVALF